MSRLMIKPTKRQVRLAKTQISLDNRSVWSESSLSAWRKLGPLATHWTHSDTQADLSFHWAHKPFCWFCHEAAQISNKYCLLLWLLSPKASGILKKYLRYQMSPVKWICVFEHSVMTRFNCACPAIQRCQGSGFLSEGSFWLTACMSEQRKFWRDCADAQARLNLRCSHRR